MAPLVADQAILGEYAVISQLLNNQVKKGEVDGFVWTDKDGRKLTATGADSLGAPAWFTTIAAIEHRSNVDVTLGGVGYGSSSGA